MLALSDVSGLACEIVRAGVAPAAALGWAARTSRGWELSVGGDIGALFDLASLTKPMTAMAVARSSLGADVKVGAVVPEARGTPSEHTSVRTLLAHRGGLEAHVALWNEGSSGAALRRAASSIRNDLWNGSPPAPAPPLYSDLGYVLVGEVLARSEGAEDAGHAIERLVVSPLGLERDLGTVRSLREALGEERFLARVQPTEDVPARGGVVRGAVHDENAWSLTGHGGSGHAGMFGTVSAVLGFACMAADVLFTEGMRWLVEPWPGGSYRCGFDVKNPDGPSAAGTRASVDTIGHLGFTGTSFWIDPRAGIVTVLLTNRVHPTRDNLRIREARPVVHDALFALAESVPHRTPSPPGL